MTVQQDIQQMSADLRAFTQEMRKFANAQSAVTKETYVYSDAVEDAKDNLAKLEKKYEKQGKVSDDLYNAQQRQLRAERDKVKLINDYEKQKVALEDLRKAYRDNGKTMTKEEKENHKQQRKAGFDRLREIQNNQKRNDAELAKVTGSIGKSVGGIAKHLNFIAGIFGAIGGSLLSFNKNFMEATANSAGVIEETTGNFDQGMGHWLMSLNATGVDPKVMIQLMAQNRQMVNSLGGMNATIKTTEAAIKDTYGMYGSMEEAWTQNLSVMTGFANKGVKPTMSTMKDYNDDLNWLARATGKTGSAMNAMLSEISDDADSISILRAAREDERETILANQRALLKSNIALGMTAEQATAASKMLNKMVAAKPLERLKQAAKMRAIGAAMGLGAESNAAANELQKPKGQQNQAVINEFNLALAKQVGSAAQQGIIPEIQTSILVEKLGFEEIANTFDTNLAKTNQSLLNLEQDYKSASDSTIVHANYMADIAGKILSSILDGTIIWSGILDATRLLNGTTFSLTEFFQAQMADFKDFKTMLHNLGEILAHPWDESKRNMQKTDNLANHEADVQHDNYIKQLREKEQADIAKNAEIRKRELEIDQKEQQRKQAALAKQREDTQAEREHIANGGVARPTTPGEKAIVEVAPNPTKESVDKTRSDKVNEVLTDQFLATVDQTNKIETQLKQMVQSNEYLKILAETNPKLVDIAEKQLAVSTMTQEQRDRMASRLRSENAKFSADYSYAV